MKPEQTICKQIGATAQSIIEDKLRVASEIAEVLDSEYKTGYRDGAEAAYTEGLRAGYMRGFANGASAGYEFATQE